MSRGCLSVGGRTQGASVSQKQQSPTRHDCLPVNPRQCILSRVTWPCTSAPQSCENTLWAGYTVPGLCPWMAGAALRGPGTERVLWGRQIPSWEASTFIAGMADGGVQGPSAAQNVPGFPSGCPLALGSRRKRVAPSCPVCAHLSAHSTSSLASRSLMPLPPTPGGQLWRPRAVRDPP